MHRAAHVLDVEASSGSEIAKLLRRAECRGAPGCVAEPAADAARCGPRAPAAQFANDEPAAGLELLIDRLKNAKSNTEFLAEVAKNTAG